MFYEKEICNKMTGKTIKEISVNGFGIRIIFTDDTEFSYSASDGGYSGYELIEKKGE